MDFQKTVKGRNMPVDPEYCDFADCEEGQMWVTGEGKCLVAGKSEFEDDGTRGRISHFSTCPYADDFSGSKKK
jgi:hypothetical protein